MDDTISRQAAIDAYGDWYVEEGTEEGFIGTVKQLLELLSPAEPEGYVKLPDSGIEDLSDGYHTFRQLYYQRMMLFAALVKQNKDKAWKSYRHEDGELCFGGGWFIVGIDTPEGSYTYHYEADYYSIFDCEELEYAKHWDGHTEVDVTRLLSLPSAEPEPKMKPIFASDGFADGNPVYDYAECQKCGYAFEDTDKAWGEPFCPHCGARLMWDEVI